MAKWKKFITDMGRSLTVESDDGETFVVDRYAVWDSWEGTSKAVVVETGPNLSKLRKKHKISDPVVELPKPR